MFILFDQGVLQRPILEDYPSSSFFFFPTRTRDLAASVDMRFLVPPQDCLGRATFRDHPLGSILNKRINNWENIYKQRIYRESYSDKWYI